MLNQRIKENAEQCYEYNAKTDDLWFNKEKFAQLIIKECISKCEFYNDSNWGPASECIAQDIKQHFGVEK